MRSTSYEKLVNRIRRIKNEINREVEGRNFDSWRAATEIMCAAWFIRAMIMKMHEVVNIEYRYKYTDLSRREYKALDKYIDKLENYYWNLLYDKGNEVNKVLLKGRNAQ